MTAAETVVIDAAGASADQPRLASDGLENNAHGHGAHRQCGWCTNLFPIVIKSGRPLVYCSRSCRQRAYERRRGLGVLPPPDRVIMRPNGLLSHLRARPEGYERGRLRLGIGKHHALRPAGIPDERGRRLTLCGLLSYSVTGRFVPSDGESCKTCARVEDVRPSGRSVRVSEELAALRSVIDAAAIEFSRSKGSRHRPRAPIEILVQLLLTA